MELPYDEVVTLDGGAVHVVWRRNARSRRITLRVDPSEGSVVLTLPKRASRQAALTLLRTHEDWVRDRMARLPELAPFVDGGTVLLSDTPHLIRHRPEARGGAWLEGAELHVAGASEFLARRTADFLHAEAGRRLGALVADKAHAASLSYRRVSIKDTRTRWGSCSPDKVLAFSWRLVMAPPAVQDYVAAHEVAHLRHMNHGPQFWALVNELTPHTRTAVSWLKQEGPRLLRIG